MSGRTPWTVRAITRATLPVLLVLTVVEIGAGMALSGFESVLFQYPTLLVLVPVTIGTAGNLGSILAARLSTAFHLGTLSFDPTDETLAGNAVATVALALTVFPVVGAAAWGLTALSGAAELSVVTVVLVAGLSGAILSVLAVAVTVVATYLAYRRGADPDDVAIPVVTNLADVIGVVVLLLVVRIVV